MKTIVYYCRYLGLEHLMLVKCGWQEHHCLYADGIQLIKLTKTENIFK